MPRTRTTRIGRGVGSGVGWGGPAKGGGDGRRSAFRHGNKAAVGHKPPDKVAVAAKHHRTEQLEDNLLALALTAERDETRVSACVALLNRLEGLPVARTLMGQDKDAAPLGVVYVPRKAEG